MIKKVLLSVLGVVVAGSITSEGALGQGYVTSTQLASISGAVSRRGESNGNGFNGSVAVNGQSCKGPGYTGTSRPLPFIPWPNSSDVLLQPVLGGASGAKAAKLNYQISNTTNSLAEVTAPPKPVPTTPPSSSGAAGSPVAGVPVGPPIPIQLWNLQARLARREVKDYEFKGMYVGCQSVGFNYPGCSEIKSIAVSQANMPPPNNGGLDFYYAYQGSFGYDAGPNPWQIGQPNQPMYSNRPPILYESYVPPETKPSGPSFAPPKPPSTYSWGDPADRPGSSSNQQWMDLKNRSYWDWRNSDVGREQSAYLKYQYDTGANRDWLLGQDKTGWIIKWEQNLISQGALKADQTVQYSFK